jgi:DNA-directed RNA polymerase III subunit RPC8
MFQLAIIEDKITCNPDQLSRDPAEVIIEQIELKYCNKVLLNVGLGISFYDFISIGDPYLYPGAGASIQVVTFRLIVFRPFVGEVITGRVLSSNKDGVKLTLDFFDDIVIPAAQLQQPSVFNTTAGHWTWKYETDSDAEYALQAGDEVSYLYR